MKVQKLSAEERKDKEKELKKLKKDLIFCLFLLLMIVVFSVEGLISLLKNGNINKAALLGLVVIGVIGLIMKNQSQK